MPEEAETPAPMMKTLPRFRLELLLALEGLMNALGTVNSKPAGVRGQVGPAD
jgi:hypothetical protein